MSATILIVEDEYAVARGIQYALQQEGYSVTVARSGEEGLTFATGQAPDLVVLDVRLPGMTGPELQDHLRRESIEIPIVFVSAHADVPTAVNAMKGGAVDFIQKPFDYRQAVAVVRRALERDAQARERHARRAQLAERLAPQVALQLRAAHAGQPHVEH